MEAGGGAGPWDSPAPIPPLPSPGWKYHPSFQLETSWNRMEEEGGEGGVGGGWEGRRA